MDKSNLYWLRNHEDYLDKDLLLYELSGSNYRIFQFGKFKPILHNGLLVENRIAEILTKYVGDQIRFTNKATIWRKSTDEKWTNYSEIGIKNNLELDNFQNAKYDGLRIYSLMYEHIFISSELKEKLIAEYEKINELDFINDCPLYGG
jgi:hypothetical protein